MIYLDVTLDEFVWCAVRCDTGHIVVNRRVPGRQFAFTTTDRVDGALILDDQIANCEFTVTTRSTTDNTDGRFRVVFTVDERVRMFYCDVRPVKR